MEFLSHLLVPLRLNFAYFNRIANIISLEYFLLYLDGRKRKSNFVNSAINESTENGLR